VSALLIEMGSFKYSLYYSSRRRSIALQIKQGMLIVRAPLGVSVVEINKLVTQKQNWILKHVQQARQQVKPDWLTQQQIPLLGNLYALQLLQATSSAVTVQEQRIVVAVSSRIQPAGYQRQVRLLLQQWYQQQASHWFAERVQHWQQQMQLCAADIVIGNWKTKWGYCKHNGEVGFNWRLMMAPAWVADYVVVHELAHLKYLDHSARFWQLVRHYYHQASEAKSWLKQHQYWMEL
jgi:predicted metal-dependent hydrolase